MSCSSMINWEEFGRSQLAQTALNLSQLCRREASDLAFHRKAVARKMIGPHSHRGGHWFDPSIAHQVSGYVDLGRGHGGSHSITQGNCRDPETHRHCPGRWRGVVSLKPGPDGHRRRKKVSGENKTEVRAKLAELHDELNDGVVSHAAYSVAQATKRLAGRWPSWPGTQDGQHPAGSSRAALRHHRGQCRCVSSRRLPSRPTTRCAATSPRSWTPPLARKAARPSRSPSGKLLPWSRRHGPGRRPDQETRACCSADGDSGRARRLRASRFRVRSLVAGRGGARFAVAEVD